MTKPSIKSQAERPTCGIVMPISESEEYTKEHWSEVLSIITDVCDSINFASNLVSKSDDVGVIHKNIIQNLYSNNIVVCDVSSLNPNVMFELGMRLAFDKPTIIIKDHITRYSFDTSPIEHIEYPRDLRFHSILKFKDQLAKKIAATHENASSDSNYSTFLKHFGNYKIAHIEEKQVSTDEFIIRSIEELKSEIRNVRLQQTVDKEKLLLSNKELEENLRTRGMFLNPKTKSYIEEWFNGRNYNSDKNDF